MPTSSHFAQMERLGDELSTLYSHITAATARWLRLLGEFDEGGGWGTFKSCAHWLAWRCGIAPGTARDHVRVARALRTRPLIAAAFERGEISYSKVRALLRLGDEYSEELLLEYATAASAGQLERIVRSCRRCTAVDDDNRQFAEREFAWSWDDQGGVVFSGRLPAELGALVVRALEAARDQLGAPPREQPDGHDGWSMAQSTSRRARNADALVAVAQSALAERSSSADVYQLVVHVDVAALEAEGVSAETRGEGPRLEDGVPLPAAAARRLACDAGVVRVLERDGNVLSVGRKTRTIPPALRRALRIRDQGCRFPGCTQRHHVDAHHIEHWADGGRTDAANLVQLCRFHHRLLHEGGYDVRRERGGSFTFLDPRGRRIPQAPRQAPGDCGALQRANHERTLAPHAMTLFPRESSGENLSLRWSVEALLDSRGP